MRCNCDAFYSDGPSTAGRTGEAAVIKQRIFEATLSVSDFHDWLELLPPHVQAEAVEWARALAAKHGDLTCPVSSDHG